MVDIYSSITIQWNLSTKDPVGSHEVSILFPRLISTKIGTLKSAPITKVSIFQNVFIAEVPLLSFVCKLHVCKLTNYQKIWPFLMELVKCSQ